jgi:HlyD family secretion protein
MNKFKVTAAVVGLGVIAGTAWFYRRAEGKEIPAYRTAPVVRATLKSTVSATGALSAVRTVQVGTQASGQISAIYVDFNDHVKKGQLLARIDPTLQQQAVEDAQAQLERADATLTQAQSEFERNQKLFDARVITASEFGTVQSNFAVQQATVKSARIALDRAKQNLAYTSIYAPIDGVIVQRNVDPGDRRLPSAPQLFQSQRPLRDANPRSGRKSDIGMIRAGSQCSSVQSYPGQISPAPFNKCACSRQRRTTSSLHGRHSRYERDREAIAGNDCDGAVPDGRSLRRVGRAERRVTREPTAGCSR